MTPKEEKQLKETLHQTELALEEATNNIEICRTFMHSTIMQWRKNGWSWSLIQETELWEIFVKIGGS